MTFDSDYEPWFQPPSFIIGPVWLVLYSMLAVSFLLLLSRRESIAKHNMLIVLFLAQLVVNLMCPVCLTQRIFDFVNDCCNGDVTTIPYLTYEHAREVSMLVWPYIVWVSFAGIINFAYLIYA